jgi:hypothetical protein
LLFSNYHSCRSETIGRGCSHLKRMSLKKMFTAKPKSIETSKVILSFLRIYFGSATCPGETS